MIDFHFAITHTPETTTVAVHVHGAGQIPGHVDVDGLAQAIAETIVEIFTQSPVQLAANYRIELDPDHPARRRN